MNPNQARAELIQRIRAAGHTTNDHLSEIDGIPLEMEFEEPVRWSKPGLDIMARLYRCCGHTWKSSRLGWLDLAGFVEELLNDIPEAQSLRAADRQRDELHAKVVEVLNECGLRLHKVGSPHYPQYFADIGTAHLEIEGECVKVFLRVPIRHRNKLRELVRFLQEF
jgi:hypothetical protein